MGYLLEICYNVIFENYRKLLFHEVTPLCLRLLLEKHFSTSLLLVKFAAAEKHKAFDWFESSAAVTS